MRTLQIIVLGVGLVGFAVGFVLQFRLHRYVSRERVLELDDITSIFKYRCVPPKAVLNDDGRRLYRFFVLGLGTFVASLFVNLLLSALGI